MQNSLTNKRSSDVKTIVVITLKLFIISVITATLLAVVNELTKERIADNIRREKENAIEALFPGNFDIAAHEGEFQGITEINTVSSNNIPVGYVAEVTPNGFGGAITLMVGVGADGEVVGVKVISHSETAGLGSRVQEAEYLAKYVGASSATAGSVDTISGATISSKAVRSGVINALSVYTDVISNGGAQ